MVTKMLGIFFHLSVFVPLQLQDELDVIIIVAGSYVKMKMKYRLPCCKSIVGKNIKPFRLKRINNCLRDDVSCFHQIGKFFLSNGEERFAVSLGKNKRMSEMDRIDIED